MRRLDASRRDATTVPRTYEAIIGPALYIELRFGESEQVAG
jgi:hypothetical protein